LGRGEAPIDLNGWIGERINAASSAQADAMEVKWVGWVRLTIVRETPESLNAPMNFGM
jgi:hypothetical protein